MVTKGCHKFASPLDEENLASLRYYESSLRFLVNYQVIPVTMQRKSMSPEQICYKKSQGIVVTSLHYLLF